ncbi:MAG TPA: DUF354 domain-containing protein [Candidatus Methanofastidiosa archaeon]|nr:DUF354 domain-containing protein [Candidatus Methanofastidiosa archaeon]HPR41702.1 DUF354 domain-containing protein [Candidatus Methanofastidiosa archaeon]
MKIWIDISNSPQIHFFKNVIRRLDRTGHEVMVTSRRFGSMESMLSKNNVDCHLVGEHGGASKEMKLKCSSRRILGLTDLVLEEKPDVALFKHSVEAPRVAYGLGIPSICVLDNEKAIAQNRLMLPISSKVIAPDAISYDEISQFGVTRDRLRSFNGFCELAHLEDFIPNGDVLGDLKLDEDRPVAILRPEPIMANYFTGDPRESIVSELLRKLGDYQCVVFPRTAEQSRMFNDMGAILPDHCVDALSLIHFSQIIISAGGSMNREAVAMGKPAISTYPEALLAITDKMVRDGIKSHSCDVEEVMDMTNRLNGDTSYERFVKKKLREMENPIDVIVEEIEAIDL